MATTYTLLLAEAANYLARGDLASFIPGFVEKAQAKINRQVRVQAMETKSASFSITGEYVAVPSDFLEVKHFYLNTNPRKTLARMDAESMSNDYTTADTPKYFSVEGANFRFAPAPSAATSSTLLYYAKPATLVTTSQETNSLFPTNADLYLYATLLEAESFIQNDPRLAVWKSGYDEALANINSQAKRSSAFGGPMITRVG